MEGAKEAKANAKLKWSAADKGNKAAPSEFGRPPQVIGYCRGDVGERRQLSAAPLSGCQQTELSQLFKQEWMSFKCQSHSSGLLSLGHNCISEAA